jgi:hypothetical protein
VKILLGDFNLKVGREDIFKPTFGNESLHESSNDNGDYIVKLCHIKNLIHSSTLFAHCNIDKCTWTCSDGKTTTLITSCLMKDSIQI